MNDLSHLWHALVHWLQSTVAILDVVVCACACVFMRKGK